MTSVSEAMAPLHAVPAEEIVLGAMMLSQHAATEVMEILTPADFYCQQHARLYSVLVGELAAGRPIDPVSVAHALDRAGLLGTSGGLSLADLHSMVAAVPTAATGSWHAQIVRERAQLRRLAEVGVRITQMAHGAADGARDATSAADLAQQWVHEATTATTAQPDLAPVSDWSQQAMAELLADEEPGIPTGLRDLDTLTGGWRPGQMVVVAGRPAMGKSMLVAGMALAAAQAGHRTLLASCEMPAQDILWRLWTAEARVPMHRVFGRQLSPQDVSALEAARQRVDDLPLHITDSAATPMQIRAAARRLSQTHGPLGMVAVDYLQRLQPDHRRDRRDLEVGEAARTLKTLAMDMDAAVITAAQLNRGLEQRMDKRPQLSDLRESGEIEQEADVVLLLHRDDYYDKESPRAGEADLIVAKNRNGPTDTISVAAQLHLARFVDLAR